MRETGVEQLTRLCVSALGVNEVQVTVKGRSEALHPERDGDIKPPGIRRADCRVIVAHAPLKLPVGCGSNP